MKKCQHAFNLTSFKVASKKLQLISSECGMAGAVQIKCNPTKNSIQDKPLPKLIENHRSNAKLN